MSALIDPTKTPAPLLQRQRISVSDRGEMVRLEMGNAYIEMDYETAIQLSAWLRLHGRRAKMFAGHVGPLINVIGLLTDANGSNHA